MTQTQISYHGGLSREEIAEKFGSDAPIRIAAETEFGTPLRGGIQKAGMEIVAEAQIEIDIDSRIDVYSIPERPGLRLYERQARCAPDGFSVRSILAEAADAQTVVQWFAAWSGMPPRRGEAPIPSLIEDAALDRLFPGLR